jgi:hypothetical protein
LLWRATLAAVLLVDVVDDLPRLERASRRASTRARLGLWMAARLTVGLRSGPLPARLALAREAEREREGAEVWGVEAGA